ncbi:DUF4139 domain-containing protein [Pseudothioclava nitratireducens]|uniref:DUF4139 domain-containing protein n=1 Tax=Pseudothioclava nitratireducens TaxID=1928646 RepID=UPI0023DC5D27|nr:DUF4139 domain-containing protein [Defluviimonas nitratireducens]MDF1619122.1 DUF4139 domain-containing protein [Defluviimonas nitratireducens]
MRHLPILAGLLIGTAPIAALADTIEARSTVTAVTLYPFGAQVTRVVEVDAPAGVHELIVPDLPDNTYIGTLRVAGEGVNLGALRLVDARQPATGEITSPEIETARAQVETLEIALAEKERGVAAIRLRASAARDKIAFLKGLSTEGTDPAGARDLAAMVGDEILSASQAALAAEAEADAADRALKPEREALDAARKALDALQNPAKAHDVLMATVEGTGTLTITTFVERAGWSPNYDLTLDRDAAKLRLERFVSVRQATGEDWTGVDLTLSTARPAEQAAPSDIWPRRLWIDKDRPMPVPKTLSRSAMEEAEYAPMAEPAVAGSDAMQMEMAGLTVTYTYGAPVDMRDGVEDLRLRLDQMEFDAEVMAEGVPLMDMTAFLVAEATNTSDEPILPGPVMAFTDGMLVGGADLVLIPAGGEFRQGFGAIDGLTLKRLEPETMAGDRGVISKSNARKEVVEITVENLTGRDWPVRILDRLPYSEQEDLEIETSIVPPASVRDLDDKRGVIAWEFDLPAGETKTLRTDSEITWPMDYILR